MGACGSSTAAIRWTRARSPPRYQHRRKLQPRWPSTCCAGRVRKRARRRMALRPTTDAEEVPRVTADSDGRRHQRLEAKGVLVLIGGACTPHGHALRSFLDLAGARSGGRIIGFTTASAEPEESARHWITTFR